MSQAQTVVSLDSGLLHATFRALPRTTLGNLLLLTFALESLLVVVAAAADSRQPLDSPSPEDYERGHHLVEEAIEVRQLTMRSPYDIYLVITGGVGAASVVANRAIHVFNNFQRARANKHVAERDIERLDAEREAYVLVRDLLNVSHSFRPQPGGRPQTSFDESQVADESSRNRLNSAIQALVLLRRLEIVSEDEVE